MPIPPTIFWLKMHPTLQIHLSMPPEKRCKFLPLQLMIPPLKSKKNFLTLIHHPIRLQIVPPSLTTNFLTPSTFHHPIPLLEIPSKRIPPKVFSNIASNIAITNYPPELPTSVDDFSVKHAPIADESISAASKSVHVPDIPDLTDHAQESDSALVDKIHSDLVTTEKPFSALVKVFDS